MRLRDQKLLYQTYVVECFVKSYRIAKTLLQANIEDHLYSDILIKKKKPLYQKTM